MNDFTTDKGQVYQNVEGWTENTQEVGLDIFDMITNIKPPSVVDFSLQDIAEYVAQNIYINDVPLDQFATDIIDYMMDAY